MRRRNLKQIQVNDQIPISNSELHSKPYASLVPVYDPKDIEYNSSFSSEYSRDNYSRDNYCMVPYKVPPMTFKGRAYVLNTYVLGEHIPKVSNLRIDYDSSIWNPDFVSEESGSVFWESQDFCTFSDIVIEAYPDFEDILDNPFCTANGHLSGYPDDYEHNYVNYQCGPLDKVDTGNLSVSDEYAYAWVDGWDMSVANTRRAASRVKDDSSSSAGGGGADVYLCSISGGVGGSGGAVTVSILSVDSNGSTTEKGTITVNIPSY